MIALCLSGGGFRAALFHLGALRRLNELGILSQVDTISSVSGGSITAAFLAQHMQPQPQAGAVFLNWDQHIAQPFRRFVSRDCRSLPFLKRVALPWNWFRPQVQTNALMKVYKKHINHHTLAELPDKPNYIFCATDIVFGVNWIFEKKRVGDYQAGYIKPAPPWPIAYAVTASSCFPPVLDPTALPPSKQRLVQGRFPAGAERDKLVQKMRLSDGGVYDNLGYEPVWKGDNILLVSDGGAPFAYQTNSTVLGRALRSLMVINKQSGALRKRWLLDNFVSGRKQGVYWGVSGSVSSYEDKHGGTQADPRGYAKELAEDLISRIRTDLNGFTPAEIGVLENHGYMLADRAVQCHLPQLTTVPNASLTLPHPQWTEPEEIAHALRHSHKRLVLKR